MPIRLACVLFPKEGRKVIPVKDIVDLPAPRGKDDFVKDKDYNIRWDVLPNEGSGTVEDTYVGKILLLAGKCRMSHLGG